ncbi:MAG: sensor histidine kinase [Pirellulales bacterium]|nr:sensor histidine kinase [Pirellulales bacterium]
MSNDSTAQRGPSLERVYYLLAAFDLLTVCVSLYVNQRVTTIYAESVRENQTWGTLQRQAAMLSSLAGEIDRPGNEVFHTFDLVDAKTQLRRAAREYHEQSTVVADALALRPASETLAITTQLRTAHEAVAEMESASFAIFEALSLGRTSAAGEQMALLDRAYSRVNHAMFEIVSSIGSIQNAHFADQISEAERFETLERMLGLAVLVMIGGAIYYGLQITQRFEAQARERDAAALALEAANDELERRVEERTKALTQANVDLQEEVGERLRAEEALRESTAARLQLADQLSNAEERERRAVAHELHDGVGQMLTSLSFGLQVAAMQVRDALPQQAAQLDNLHRVAATTLEEVRRLVRGLRPIVLDELGLAAALKRLVTDLGRDSGIDVKLDNQLPGGLRLPEHVETAIYRLVQEALNNTQRHASAKHASVELGGEGEMIRVCIMDDGRGFDPAVLARNQANHVGLAGMRERAERLQGRFQLQTAPGRGTLIEVEIPSGISTPA